MNTNISTTPSAVATLDVVSTAEPTLEATANPTVEPTAEATTEAVATIPPRPATTSESLKLIGEGWGSIFVVIGIMIVVVALLNKVFSGKKK